MKVGEKLRGGGEEGKEFFRRKCKQRGEGRAEAIRFTFGWPANRREIILLDAVSAHSRAQRAPPQFPNVNRTTT